MNKVNAVLSKISDDPSLTQSFINLDNLEDVKNFIKKFDSEITDEELCAFLDDIFSEMSIVVDDGLHNVSGGPVIKKFLLGRWHCYLLCLLPCNPVLP